ncbi:MAG: O-antigen ligase C-terminal domain-containing protein [Magnetococcales bacterium]|nr:O-antigen ligase C-terminal domain-containing protein [Magnetococcales bacterium]
MTVTSDASGTPRQLGIFLRMHLFLLYGLFLFVIHIYVPALGSGPIVPIAAHLVWLTVAAVVAVALLYALKRGVFVVPDYTKYYLLFLILVLLSAQFQDGVDSHVLVFQTAGLIGGLLFFVALHQFNLTEGQRDGLLLALFVSGAVESVVGLFQVFYPQQTHALLPFSAGWPPGSAPSGFLNQGNQLASFLATCLVISFYLIVSKQFERWHWFFRAIFFLVIPTMISVLLCIGSRAGALGSALGAWILLFAQWQDYRVRWRRLFLRIMALLVALVFMHVTNMMDRLYVLGDKLAHTISRRERIDMYGAAWDMFLDRPLWGQGPGGWVAKQPYYRINQKNDYQIDEWYPHNETLYWLAETGVAGGVGVLAIVGGMAVLLVRLGRRRGGMYAALMVPIVFHAEVEQPLHDSIAHWIILVFLAYLPSSHFTREMQWQWNPVVRGGLATVALCLFLLVEASILRTVRAQMDLNNYMWFLTKHKDSRAELLQPGLDNLYLRQLATRLFMDVKLKLGLLTQDSKMVEEFVSWSRRERKIWPNSLMFVNEAKALLFIGDRGRLMPLLEEGLTIYPQAGELLELKKAVSPTG